MVTPAIVVCPHCGTQHVDQGRWARFDHARHLCMACRRFFEVPSANIGVASL